MRTIQKSECDALYYHIYIHACGFNHYRTVHTEIRRTRTDLTRFRFKNDIKKKKYMNWTTKTADWLTETMIIRCELCVCILGEKNTTKNKTETNVARPSPSTSSSSSHTISKMLKGNTRWRWIEKTMRTHIHWNASKFMHRRKYHKLLNKQLIFETISNTLKSNRTQNQKPKKKETKLTTTTNKPTFWRWCYVVWNIHCLLCLHGLWFCCFCAVYFILSFNPMLV